MGTIFNKQAISSRLMKVKCYDRIINRSVFYGNSWHCKKATKKIIVCVLCEFILLFIKIDKTQTINSVFFCSLSFTFSHPLSTSWEGRNCILLLLKVSLSKPVGAYRRNQETHTEERKVFFFCCSFGGCLYAVPPLTLSSSLTKDNNIWEGPICGGSNKIPMLPKRFEFQQIGAFRLGSIIIRSQCCIAMPFKFCVLSLRWCHSVSSRPHTFSAITNSLARQLRWQKRRSWQQPKINICVCQYSQYTQNV